MTRRRDSIATGAVLAVAMRWSDRLLGVLSMLVLARLLTPADFGILAMAMMAVGLIDVLLDLGVSISLIQNRDATDRHFNTAWTLRLLQSAAAALLIAGCASPAASYFRDERVTSVMLVVSMVTLVGGLENIGTVKFQKEFQFSREFVYLFSRRILSFAVTIVAAVVLRSYWALVIGMLVGRFFSVALSYLVHEYRPRLSLAAAREMLGFSQWLVVRGVGAYLDGKVDQFSLGRMGSASALGTYSISSEISAIPTTELLAPISRVLFPAFVEARANADALRRAFLLGMAVQALVGIPAGIGLALVAPELIVVLLGPGWAAAVPVVQVLSLVNVVSAMNHGPGYLLLSSGRVQLLALVAWLQLLVFVVVLFALAPLGEVRDFAVIRLVAVVTCFGVVIGAVKVNFSFVRYVDLLSVVANPIAATAVMVFVLYAVSWPSFPPLALLAMKVMTGAATYVGAILLIWQLRGRREGAESYLLAKAMSVYRRLRIGRASRKENS